MVNLVQKSGARTPHTRFKMLFGYTCLIQAIKLSYQIKLSIKKLLTIFFFSLVGKFYLCIIEVMAYCGHLVHSGKLLALNSEMPLGRRWHSQRQGRWNLTPTHPPQILVGIEVKPSPFNGLELLQLPHRFIDLLTALNEGRHSIRKLVKGPTRGLKLYASTMVWHLFWMIINTCVLTKYLRKIQTQNVGRISYKNCNYSQKGTIILC